MYLCISDIFLQIIFNYREIANNTLKRDMILINKSIQNLLILLWKHNINYVATQ